MTFELFQYDFMLRGLAAGFIVAVVAPLVGIFLVLRRYSLIADTLSHVSLAGISVGLLLGVNPALTGVAAALLASFGLERLRLSRRLPGDAALAIFLFGSLAVAIVILSLARGLNSNLFAYLFGSILTVTAADLWLIGLLALVAAGATMIFFKELVFLAFDEEGARVAGLPVKALNLVFVMIAALLVSVAIPVVGVLLIAALVVLPVLTALQLRRSFRQTLIYAIALSVIAVFSGIALSFYADLAASGTIVLILIAFFLLALAKRR